MSDVRPLDAADKRLVLRRCLDDFWFYNETVLRAIDESAPGFPVVPLVARAEQRIIIDTVLAQYQRGEMMRAWLLKARRIGGTLIIQAFQHWMCARSPRRSALSVAHFRETTKNVVAYNNTFNDQMPVPFQKYFAAKKLGGDFYWPNGSRIRTKTAGSPESAKSEGTSFIHMSEVASYHIKRPAGQDEQFLEGLMGSIIDTPDSVIFGESTSSGPNGCFWDRFMKATKREKGNRFVPIFFAFQDSELYSQLMYPTPKEEISTEALMRESYARGDLQTYKQCANRLGYSEVWAHRAVTFGLSAGQVRWAVEKVVSDYNGDLRRFDRNFPCSIQIAFNAGERSAFSDEVIAGWRIGSENAPKNTMFGDSLVLLETGGYGLDADGGSSWRIYYPPVEGHEYVIGVDVGGGTGNDNSAIQVIDRHTRSQVAEYMNNHIGRSDLHHQFLAAAKWYNNAFIVIENEPGSIVTIDKLRLSGYPNVFMNVTGESLYRVEQQLAAIGYPNRSQRRKQELMERFIAEANRGFQVHSERFLNEAVRYREVKPDTYDHPSRGKSDAVIAMALAWFGDWFLPSIRRPELRQVVRALSPMERDMARAANPNGGGLRTRVLRKHVYSPQRPR